MLKNQTGLGAIMSSRINVNSKGMKASAFVVLLLLIAVCLFSAAASHAESLSDKSIRELIIRLNDNYFLLNKHMQELEDNIKDFPGTLMEISVVKGDPYIELVSMEVWDKGNLLKNHVYTPIDNEALGMGGRHELYHGEVRKGAHIVKIVYYWKDEKKSVQKEEKIIPISIAAGTTQYVELSFEKRKDKLELIHTQLDFSN